LFFDRFSDELEEPVSISDVGPGNGEDRRSIAYGLCLKSRVTALESAAKIHF
jgi:hypothetical protein